MCVIQEKGEMPLINIQKNKVNKIQLKSKPYVLPQTLQKKHTRVKRL